MEKDKELRVWSYWTDCRQFYGGYQHSKHEYDPETGTGGVIAYSKEDAYERVRKELESRGLKVDRCGGDIQGIYILDKSYPLPDKTKIVDLGDLGIITVPKQTRLGEIKDAILDCVSKKFSTKQA